MTRYILAVVLLAGTARADLVAERDRLVAELEKKPVAESLLLRFDEGAERDTMNVTLRRVGGQWATGYAEVPGWQQSTMQEWRGFYHANESGCWRPTMRFPAETTALKLDGKQLSGGLNIAYRLDTLLIERQPPGTRLQWWDKFIPAGYTTPRQHLYTLDAEVRPDACLLELVLEGGLYWDAKFVPDAKKPGSGITRKPITVRLQVPSTRFTLATARTPTWIGGFHEADPTGLKFANGKLTGKLVVFIHQDGWMPWGGGKHTQHEPMPITFEIDAELKNNQLAGKYAASLGGPLKGAAYRESEKTIVLPDTNFDGAISGRGGKLVVGRYAAQGDLGEQVGALDGLLLDQPVPLREQIAASKDVFHQVRALHLALQHYPLPYGEAYRQTDMPAPTSEYTPPPFVAAAFPAAKPETVGDSPSLGASPLANNELPADAQGWFFLPQWNVLGPFEQRVGLENNGGLVPDIAVVPDAAYTQPVDRLGAVKTDEKPVQWQPVACNSPRLGVPWENTGMFVRYTGRLWYGAATLRSAAARTVWLALEANDFAKLWVNNQLVWADAEKTWRYRQQGRVFVPVALKAGENQLLARVHGDRRLSWLRLALTTKEPVPAAAPPALYANPFIFADAQPPLAWDIAKGINVAWRKTELAGNTRPLVVGDVLLVSSPGRLTCLDLDGKERWSAAIEGDTAEPVSDGKLVWCAGSALACFDLAGKQIWSQPTGLAVRQLSLAGTRVVVEGAAKSFSGVCLFEAATGQELKRWELPGRFEKKSQLLAMGDLAVLIAGTGACLDIVHGAELPAPDIEMQLTKKAGDRTVLATNLMDGPYVLSRNADMFFLTSQARHQAVRLWVKDGKLGYAHAWESNYGNSGFGNVPAPAVANERFLFTTHSVLAHTPHMPDPRAEINVQDVKTGCWLGRLKPAMDDLYSYGALNLKSPVIAGEYLFLLGGRADNKRNQITIATADEQLQMIANNDVDPGTGPSPVFAGGRMFLRSPTALTCIAVTTPEGKQYQNVALARTLLKVVGPQPQSAKPRVIAGLKKVSAMGDVPVGKLVSERTTEFWLGAGPMDVSGLSLPDTAGVKFTPVDRDHAFNEPPMYLRTGELQGTGDITPHFKTDLDPTGHAGPKGAGLFYTVLDNTRDRVVVPALRAAGVTQWLGGQELKPDEPLYLKAGLYPYLLKVAPSFFKVEVKQELPSVKIVEALAANAVQALDWPKAWQVIGPVPADAPPLTEAQLRAMPKKLTVGELELPVYEVPVTGNMVNLNALSETAPGQKPDLASAPAKITTTSPMRAYLFAQIECPADGYLYITAGADWHMQWFVDGTPLTDRVKEGVTGKIEAHRFTARVTKGRHVVAAMVKPGADGWSLISNAAFSEKSPDQLAEFRIEPPPARRPDLQLNPSFREIPHPPTLEEMWRDRAARNRSRLETVRRDLPGTDEAKQATEMLERLK